jgi:hypothetical protein
MTALCPPDEQEIHAKYEIPEGVAGFCRSDVRNEAEKK